MKLLFTIATNSHLGSAKAMIKSFLDHNDGYLPVICLLDNYDALSDHLKISPETIVCSYNELQSVDVKDMTQRYNPFELSCAMKPFFAAHLLEKYQPSQLVYLDSDIVVFDNLNFDFLFETNAILLTPHCTAPYKDMDLNLLNYGLYNAGFFGVKNDSTSKSFLQWWKKSLVNDCVIDLINGKYVDQIWLNLAPIYFENVHIIKDLGYNVARWNLQQRVISKHQGKYLINGQSPLKFFHYSGYDPVANSFPMDNPYIPEIVSSTTFQNLIGEIKVLLMENDFSSYKLYQPDYGYIPPVEVVPKINTRLVNHLRHYLKKVRK